MEVAKHEFETLWQTNNMTFSDFLIKFIHLSDHIDYTNDLKIMALNQKISPVFLDTAIYIEQPSHKDTDVFQKWIDFYICLATQIENRKYCTKLDNFGFQQICFAPIQPPALYKDTMDIDTIHLQKLTEVERWRHQTNNLCIYCGGTGHFAYECPEKANPIRGRGGYCGCGHGAPPVYQNPAQPIQIRQIHQNETPKPYNPSTAPLDPTAPTNPTTDLDDASTITNSDWQDQPKA